MDIQYRIRHDLAMVGAYAFRCPVCGASSFRRVIVPRADGAAYPTCFYECAGCSVMFVDVQAFSANEPGPPRSRGAQVPPPPPDTRLPGTGGGGAHATDEPAATGGSPLPDR